MELKELLKNIGFSDKFLQKLQEHEDNNIFNKPFNSIIEEAQGAKVNDSCKLNFRRLSKNDSNFLHI